MVQLSRKSRGGMQQNRNCRVSGDVVQNNLKNMQIGSQRKTNKTTTTRYLTVTSLLLDRVPRCAFRMHERMG